MPRLFRAKRRAFATIVFGGSILVGATVSFAGEKKRIVVRYGSWAVLGVVEPHQPRPRWSIPSLNAGTRRSHPTA